MWVIYLEMGLAFALLILIVWWTWPRKRRADVPAREADGHGAQRDGEPR